MIPRVKLLRIILTAMCALPTVVAVTGMFYPPEGNMLTKHSLYSIDKISFKSDYWLEVDLKPSRSIDSYVDYIENIVVCVTTGDNAPLIENRIDWMMFDKSNPIPMETLYFKIGKDIGADNTEITSERPTLRVWVMVMGALFYDIQFSHRIFMDPTLPSVGGIRYRRDIISAWNDIFDEERGMKTRAFKYIDGFIQLTSRIERIADSNLS